jgi:SAM-dependent methyltransferase
MSIANTEQAEHWNTGPGVAHWVANQARYDRMHAPFTALILQAAALRPGENVLDVGCGCGGTTLAAARLVAPGQALGLDLSGPMLARARSDAEAAGLANVAFQQGDAQVQPLEPASFEVVISRFGVMSFADPVAAFANIRSATRPGGRLVFACWQPLAANQWLLVPGAALAEHVRPPAPVPADGPGMFAFSEPDRLRPILAAPYSADTEITRSTPRSWSAAAGPSTTRTSSCAPRRRAGPCSPAPTPPPRTARSPRSAPRSPPTPTPAGSTWTPPSG